MRMLEGERELRSPNLHTKHPSTMHLSFWWWPAIQPLLVGACYQMSAPGTHVTPVKVDMPRILGNQPTQLPKAGSGKIPTLFLIGTSTLLILQEHTLHGQVQAEATWR